MSSSAPVEASLPTEGTPTRAEDDWLQGSAERWVDLSTPQLIEQALRRGEGTLAANGALVVRTGERTGRSPKDRFLVDDPALSAEIDWGPINRPMAPEQFETLWARALQALPERSLFVSHLEVGAHEAFATPVRVITEYAWHNLFARQLFVRPAAPAPAADSWTLLNLPSLNTDPQADGVNSESTLAVDLAGRRILALGLKYGGEMKKAMFSVMNYLMPARGVLPMHCAANVGESGDVTLFFGLSGTGKTTLSADPERFLIGDDEHGWSEDGIFNFEGGCYAKTIDLTEEREPVIWNAIRFGATMENVALDPLSHAPIYDDRSLTENTRVAYAREHIEQRMPGNRAGQPSAIVFLTCDMYGVLPPVARLTKEQAAYHFLSGYTALVGSTEVGSGAAIKPTFSHCFGAPFFPRAPRVYAELLMEKIERYGTPVYLVNTGWTGGAYEAGGRRFSIATTRSIVHAIQRGEIEHAPQRELPGLGLKVPTHVRGVDDHILDPRSTWADPDAYDRAARELTERFIENFRRFEVGPEILAAGPRL